MKSPAVRLRPPEERVQTIETDVLVVGGGVGGCLAVVGAAEAGARVVVCEKGGIIERSGGVASGVDHFLAVLEEGPEWDTPDYLLRHIPALTEGVVEMDVAARLVHGLKPMLHRLERMGVDFHDPEAGNRRYYRHRVFGLPGEYHVNFEGRDFKHIIGRAARNAGALVLERVMVPELLMREGRPAGAVAFHIRHGTVYFVHAKAIVLATGDANRLSRNASGLAFDSWHSPYNTGDGQAMALRNGARLANMEFTESSVSPKGYSSQGLNAFTGGGCHLVNTLGERFMSKYHPEGERARRSDLVYGVVAEILAGRGPIYCDCTHLPEEEIRRLENTLVVDRPAMPSFFKQKKIDLAREPFEVTVTEMSSRRGGVYFRGSGVHIDTDAMSSIPGLFAAGDCSTMSAGISGASVIGFVAGESAARYALARKPPKPVSEGERERILNRLVRPLERPGEYRFHHFEDEVRRIVTTCVGYRREEGKMREGLRRLRALRERAADMRADDFHGLMRVYEAKNIRDVAEALAVSAIERRESRGQAGHVRTDYPEKDESTGLRIIMVERAGDELKVSSRPTEARPEALER